MTNTDRNFDDIADHFEKKVYGSKKGQIRLAVLWRDIDAYLKRLNKPQAQTPLRVLDVAGGLGQLSCRLAAQGHDVTLNDISANMLSKAKTHATQAGVSLSYVHAPYQQLPDIAHTSKAPMQYDLILCHALLEWLADPSETVGILASLLAPKGTLSLCFYNPVAKIYRNLIMGNFYNVERLSAHQAQSDTGSLTPNTPCDIDTVKGWLTQAELQPFYESGIRVFSDYAQPKRGGHADLQAVIEKELAYSTQHPYKYLGRYFHVLARHTPAKHVLTSLNL